jgi:hypothetical protein
MDEEAHAILIIFILKRVVDVMSPRRNALDTLEERPRLPELVVDPELQPLWRVQQQKKPILMDLRIGKVLLLLII